MDRFIWWHRLRRHKVAWTRHDPWRTYGIGCLTCGTTWRVYV